MDTQSAPLSALLEALDLLIEQARAYERALPASDYRARAAVAALNRLAQHAHSEALSLADASPTNSQSSQPVHPFSPREYQVLSLAAQGLTNKEIAYRLGISERTVQFHINSIFNKTATNSRTEAVALALRNGWLSLNG
jgi:DNA-binding NarL/FixJ family response regulator